MSLPYFRINSCPSNSSKVNCSGHGVCIDGFCTCDAMYSGDACDIPICPNNCSGDHGICNKEKHKCECHDPFRG